MRDLWTKNKSTTFSSAFFVTGFQGDRCQINYDDCVGNLCQNGGRCVDGVNTYTCDCPPNYTGENCEIDVDECLDGNPCQNGATCTNTRGSYQCYCVNGFEGEKN